MNDPRVRRRIEAVVDFLVPYMSHGEQHGDDMLVGPYEFSALRLRQVFGNASSNPLSRWLMANVLQQTGFYRVGEFPYAYFIKPSGVEKVLRLLDTRNAQKASKK